MKKRWGMGLFKKKKKLQFPSESLEKKEAEEMPDFDKIPSEAALPSPEFEKIGVQPTPQVPSIPRVQEEELPVPEPTPIPRQIPPEPGQEPEEVFELPDFDEKGIKELEKIRVVKKEVEKERAELKPTSLPSKDLKKPELEKPIEYPEQIRPIIHPEPEKHIIRPRTNYIDIKDYLQVKEDLDGIGKLADTTGGRVEQHTTISKTKDKKYRILADNLDIIQDKLILIDNKLFETTQDSEVNI